MNFESYLLEWLSYRTVGSRISNVARIERYYGPIAEALGNGNIARIIEELTYSSEDQRCGRPNPSRIPINGNIYNGLATLRSALRLYLRYLRDHAPTYCRERTDVTPPVPPNGENLRYELRSWQVSGTLVYTAPNLDELIRRLS